MKNGPARDYLHTKERFEMAENEEVLETAESDGDAARGGTPEAPSPESRSGRRRPPENERGGVLMKYNRQSEIIALINENEIEKQDELSERLREKGYMVTQATISRDIRELGLIKVTGSTGKYKYALPRREQVPINSKFRNLLIETVTGLDCANNIAVVKTCAGMASGAAAAIDSMSHNDIVGSVAGDDTIIIVMRTNEAASTLIAELRSIIDK